MKVISFPKIAVRGPKKSGTNINTDSMNITTENTETKVTARFIPIGLNISSITDNIPNPIKTVNVIIEVELNVPTTITTDSNRIDAAINFDLNLVSLL